MKMLAIFLFARQKTFDLRLQWSLGFLLVISILITPSAALSEEKGSTVIKGVNFTATFNTDSESLLFEINRKAPALLTLSSYKSEVIENPLRLVVDLPGLTTHRPEKMLFSDSHLVKGMRSGQQKEGARLVFDLKERATFTKQLSADSRSLTITFSKEEGAVTASTEETVTTTTIPQVVESTTSSTTSTILTTTTTATTRSSTTTEPLKLIPTPLATAKKTPIPSRTPSPTKSPTVTPTPTVSETPKPSGSSTFNISISGSEIQPDKLLKFSVDKNFLSIEKDDRPIKDITVVNKSDKPLFLRTEVERVSKPGSKDEHFQKTKDLLASPRGFELSPLASRQVRLVLATKRPSSGEDIYRVTIAPLDNLDEGVPVSASINETEASLNIIAGLGVIVTVPSVQSEGTINAKVENDRAVFISAGTRMVALENCSDCSMKSEECTNFPRKLLYPGIIWSVPIRSSGVVSCTLRIGKESNKLILPYGNSEVQ